MCKRSVRGVMRDELKDDSGEVSEDSCQGGGWRVDD